MIVCDHADGLTLRYIFEGVAKHQDTIQPLNSDEVQLIESTCSICGARVKITVTVDLAKKGKSRKTNRLWALLKGVA